MRAGVVAACSALVLLLALGMVGAGIKRTSAQEAPPARKHFLEVGKSYAFDFGSLRITTKVVEEPRGDWVAVESDTRSWIHLALVRTIDEQN